MMSVDRILLWRGVQANEDIGSFAVIYVYQPHEDRDPEVRLAVETDEDRTYDSYPGDTFCVRDQTWKLDRVEDPGGSDWTVVLTKVE
jgi:hypothetical protein